MGYVLTNESFKVNRLNTYLDSGLAQNISSLDLFLINIVVLKRKRPIM